MALPIFQDSNKNLMLMQTGWASSLNPVIGNPISSGLISSPFVLKTGVNVINHLLGRTQQGWIVIDQNAAVTLFRSQPFNDKTLTLTSSGAATVTLYVF